MDVFEEVRTILGEILDVEEREITPESYLTTELGAESIDLIELAAALNQRFGIEIDEEEIFLETVRNYFREGQDLSGDRLREAFPFLTAGRLREISADPDGPLLKVKDLVSYLHWRLEKG